MKSKIKHEQDIHEIYDNNPKMLEIHLASGEYCSEDLMVALLYRLMRDEVTPGVVEGIVQDILRHKDEDTGEVWEVCFTNGWLAQYAANIIERVNS